MEGIVDKLITVGVGLALLAGTWFIWFLSGVANNLFNEKKWSWKRALEDITKTSLMGLTILAWVVLAEVLDWYTQQVGMDISALLDGASITGLIAIICGGSGYYTMKAFRNFATFIGTDHVAKQVGEANYAAVAEPVKEFVETITGKTSKEDVESAANTSDDPILDYKQIPDELAGMGGFANTYPEPYRSAAQDSMLDPSTCYNRECVSYCAWKIKELTGNWLKRTGGMNAKYWVQRLAENGYGKIVGRPQNGGKYIGVSTAGQYGHVVWFEEENVITEYNYAARGAFSVRAINLNAYTWVEIKAPDTKAEAAAETPAKKPTTKKTVEYTYQAGDTFGTVITTLGLKTSHGLWDPVDGDVAYYTKQLGISGNIPVGTKLVFTKRA